MTKTTPRLSSSSALRERAEKTIAAGPVTEDYAADQQKVLEMLNTALATELVCVLRYKRHHFIADGLRAATAAREFAEHAAEEQEHADSLARRIVQLGGTPDMDPDSLSKRSHSRYDESEDLDAMIEENLVSERIAIESYREMIRFLGNDDPTTRRVLEEILAVEETHADDLAGFLDGGRARS